MTENTIATAYVQIAPSTKGMTESLNEAMGDAGKSGGEKFSSSFGKIAGTAGKVALAAVGAAAAGVTALTKEAVSGYSEYEQLVGGVETLFGTQGMTLQEYAQSIGQTAEEAAESFIALEDAQTEVMNNASEAYKNAGMSANEYMETVTGFAASLKQSTSSELEAAQIADMAVIDMADNANKMGTSMESIQNAYQGFAKQNYTMLDNLKLGYGGTKSEMERLLADATALTGIDYDIDSLSDVYSAIHVIQDELGITGTTAKEASSTIQGSLGMLSASWDNLIVGFTNPDADLDSLIDDLISSAETAIENFLPAIERALGGIADAVAKTAPIIAEKLPTLIEEILPGLITAATELINGLVGALPSIIQILVENIPTLANAIIEALPIVIETILGMLPQLIETVVQVIHSILEKLSEMMPELIPTIIEGILLVVETLIDNLPLLLDGVLQLVIGIAEGIINALPILIKALPTIITGIIDFILKAIPQLIEAVITIVLALVEALPTIIRSICDAIPQLIESILTAILDNLPLFIEAGITLFVAIVKAMPQIVKIIVEAVPMIIKGIVKALSDNGPKIRESGKKMLIKIWDGLKENIHKIKEVGKDIINGLVQGLKDKISAVTDTVKEIGGKISDGFKDFFGIHSPSTLFAEYGGYIDEGLAEGVLANEDVVKDAMSSLTDATTGDIKTELSVRNIGEEVAGHTFSAGSQEGSFIQSLYELLAVWLPLIARERDVTVRLDANIDRLFKAIVERNELVKKQNGGTSAFA